MWSLKTWTLSEAEAEAVSTLAEVAECQSAAVEEAVVEEAAALHRGEAVHHQEAVCRRRHYSLRIHRGQSLAVVRDCLREVLQRCCYPHVSTSYCW
jgi:hypothetical protein